METNNGTLTTEDQLKAELDRLKRENEILKQGPKKIGDGKISVRLSEKGNGIISVYGLGRFPVSLYEEQWKKLFAKETIDAVNEFIVDAHAKGLFPSKEQMEKNKKETQERTKETIKLRAEELAAAEQKAA